MTMTMTAHITAMAMANMAHARPQPGTTALSDDSKAVIVDHLRTVGLRPTVARIGVWQALEAQAPHRLDVETVFRDMLERGLIASQGTVYRALKDFVEHGFVIQEWRNSLCGSKAVYTLNPSAGPTGGHSSSLCGASIVCEQCGCSTQINDPSLQERLRQLAQSRGLELAAEPMTILAVCSQCARHRPTRRHIGRGYRDGLQDAVS